MWFFSIPFFLSRRLRLRAYVGFQVVTRCCTGMYNCISMSNAYLHSLRTINMIWVMNPWYETFVRQFLSGIVEGTSNLTQEDLSGPSCQVLLVLVVYSQVGNYFLWLRTHAIILSNIRREKVDLLIGTQFRLSFMIYQDSTFAAGLSGCSIEPPPSRIGDTAEI